MAGLVCVGLYFAPSIVAAARHTHNVAGIFVLNLLLGWTGIGWLIAMILALTSAPYYAGWHYDYPPRYYPSGYYPPGYYPPRRW